MRARRGTGWASPAGRASRKFSRDCAVDGRAAGAENGASRCTTPRLRFISGDRCAPPFLSVTLILVLAGCVAPAPPSAPDMALAPTQTTLWRCRDFTVPVTVEGQQQQAVG